jgi:tRNA-dihydrouridine synthase
MRKHLAWYLKGFPDAASIRDKINTCKTLADYQELLESVATELEYQ